MKTKNSITNKELENFLTNALDKLIQQDETERQQKQQQATIESIENNLL